MATLDYRISLSTSDDSYTYTPATTDATDYRVKYTIQANTNCTAKFQYSSDGGNTWTTITAGSLDSVDVDSTTVSDTFTQAGWIRVGVTNDDAGETDSVTVHLDLESASPSYCSAADVAKHMQLWDFTSGGRLTFGTTTYPTLVEVNEMIIENEDYIDSITGHAWRTRRNTNEYHDYTPPASIGRFDRVSDNRSVKLNHRSVRSLQGGSDTFELWNGSSWNDLVENSTEGRGNDYWVDYTNGIVYFKGERPTRTGKVFRASYNYGETSVPSDIRQAASLLTAIQILLTTDYQTATPDGVNEYQRIQQKVDYMQKKVDRIINERMEMTMVIN